MEQLDSAHCVSVIITFSYENLHPGTIQQWTFYFIYIIFVLWLSHFKILALKQDSEDGRR
jgi:hypothetical protein